MLTPQLLAKAALLGYIIAGIFAVSRVTQMPAHERPGVMVRPTFAKKIAYGLFWFVFCALDAYHAHMPNRARGGVYAVLSPPIMWLGFTVLGAASLYPHLVIENKLLAILGSAASFAVASIFLAPLVGMLCGLLVVIIAAPLTMFLPKR